MANEGFWPQELVQELAERRGLIVLGAGAPLSCGASGRGHLYPTWRQLLEGLIDKLPAGDKDAATTALDQNRFLDSAQIVVDRLSSQTYQARLIELLGDPTVTPSSLYESVHLIDQPVVVTTNYDKIYESYWDLMAKEDMQGSKPPLMVRTCAQNDVIDHLRSERRLLLKVHGCISDPKGIILSRSQYRAARYEHGNYFRVLSALMLTRTMLFIGSGFNGDPDLDLLLEDAAFTAQSSAPHYALLPAGRHGSELRALSSGSNVEALEYDPADGHKELLVRLTELAELVDRRRYA